MASDTNYYLAGYDEPVSSEDLAFIKDDRYQYYWPGSHRTKTVRLLPDGSFGKRTPVPEGFTWGVSLSRGRYSGQGCWFRGMALPPSKFKGVMRHQMGRAHAAHAFLYCEERLAALRNMTLAAKKHARSFLLGEGILYLTDEDGDNYYTQGAVGMRDTPLHTVRGAAQAEVSAWTNQYREWCVRKQYREEELLLLAHHYLQNQAPKEPSRPTVVCLTYSHTPLAQTFYWDGSGGWSDPSRHNGLPSHISQLLTIKNPMLDFRPFLWPHRDWRTHE